MSSGLLFFITIIGSSLLICLIVIWLLCSQWIKCFKCSRPVKTIKNNKLCKICKKEGFRIKTNKQILYEAWEKKIDVEKVEEIYKK